MITVTILTKDSAQHIRRVLDSVAGFDEVLLLDNGSSDDTLDIAARYPNVTVARCLFDGFGLLHNRAAHMARNDWILSIDSDEVMTPELVEEVKGLQLDPKAVYALPRKNFYQGQWIRGCGWWPDRVKRLYHREHTKWTDDHVHEEVIAHGKPTPLKAPLEHYSYSGPADFIAKMQLYSDLYAAQHRGKKRGGLCKAVLHGLWTFIKSYLLKWGFVDGKAGLEISVYNANTAFYKYLKLGQ